MILGAGETSELTARALADQGAGTIFVANRHADRALSLAQRFGGSVVGLDGLPDQLLEADIVLSSTSSPHPIVGREELELVMRERGGPAAAADRHRGAARHRPRLRRARGREPVRHRRPAGRRRAQPQHARGGDAARRSRSSRRRSTASRAGSASSTRCRRSAPCASTATSIVEQVLAENSGRWESASPRDLARVEAIARAVMSRLLHEPTIRLRSLGEDRGHASLELVRELFALRDDTPRGRATSRRSRDAGNVAEVARPAPARPRARCVDAHRNPAAARSRLHRPSWSPSSGRARRCDPSSCRSAYDRAATGAPAARGQVALGGSSSRTRCCDGEIDLAVHSAKDVPGELADGLSLLASPPAGPAEDVLCGADGLDRARAGRARRHEQHPSRSPSCAPRARISRSWRCAATSTRACASSPRVSSTRSCSRAPGWSGWTRVRGRRACSTRRSFVPAPGQGALALEARARGRARARAPRAAITDADTFACLLAERALARALGAELPHAARRLRRARPAAAACTCAPGSGCPTARRGSSDELLGGFDDPQALGRDVARRLKLGRGRGAAGARRRWRVSGQRLSQRARLSGRRRARATPACSRRARSS